jgi:hypothetical protein
VTIHTEILLVQELIQLKSDLEQVIALTQELITTNASTSALQEVGLSILSIFSSSYNRGCALHFISGNIPTFCTMNAYHTLVFK